MDALDMITETETSFFSVFVSSYYFLCVRHGPSQENNGSGECQLLVSPAPDVSVCDPQQVMDTDQQVAATPAPGDHWDLISELLSTQRRRDPQISSWPHTNHHHVLPVWSIVVIINRKVHPLLSYISFRLSSFCF